jgi:hypothetical protein
MRSVKLLVLTGLALLAFGAMGTAIASAEEGAPSILCLTGECAKLSGTLTAAKSELGTLKGKKFLEGAAGTTELKNCEAFEGKTTDTRLCKDVPLTFTGVQVTGTTNACQSENDVAGTVLLLVDLHAATEKTSAGVLQPLLLARVLNASLGEVLKLTCAGGVNVEVKGTVPCLASPGLANTESLEVVCKATKQDQETGTCELLCELLTSNPFQSNFGGGFEDAFFNVTFKGKLNQTVFIDD